MKYKVTVEREWTEQGEVTVEADSAEAARDLANAMLNEDDTAIEWDGHNMSPQGDRVVSVQKSED